MDNCLVTVNYSLLSPATDANEDGRRLPATLFALAALTGCASVSDIAGEPVAVFPAAPEAPKAWAKAGISEELPEGNWIAQFNDPVMEALVTETLTANPDLRAQLAVVR